MSKRTFRVLFASLTVLLVVLAVVLTAFLRTSRFPFGFIPDSANVIRMPKRGWDVYVFPADFKSIMPGVRSELTGLGFKEGKRPSADPDEVRIFSKTYADGSAHHIEIYDKKLGSVGKSASATTGKWVSVSSYNEHYYRRRIQRLIRRTKQRISRNP